MTRIRFLPVCLVMLGFLLLTLERSQGQEEISISIDAPQEIIAGDAWSLIVTVEGLSVGETIQTVMIHGVAIYSEELQLGTGGVALWQFEAGVLTQAGVSQVIITTETTTARFNLMIQTSQASQLIAFTTSNSLTAYGELDTTLLSLLSDAYGNPIDNAIIRTEQTSPSGESHISFMRTHYGLGSQTISSLGNPGILRLLLRYGTDIETPLTIIQLGGVAHTIELSLSANCLLADGLDDLTITAIALDQANYPVTDGQVILFDWDSGGGTGITLDGSASLRIPAPRQVGIFTYTASSGSLIAEQSLEITDGQCHD